MVVVNPQTLDGDGCGDMFMSPPPPEEPITLKYSARPFIRKSNSSLIRKIRHMLDKLSVYFVCTTNDIHIYL